MVSVRGGLVAGEGVGCPGRCLGWCRCEGGRLLAKEFGLPCYGALMSGRALSVSPGEGWCA